MIDVIDSNEFEPDDELFRAVKSMFYKNNGPHYTAFYSRNSDGLSVDWSKLTTPEQSLSRHDETYICMSSVSVEFVQNAIKELFDHADLCIVHEPTDINPAHCLIKGQITQGMAKQFARVCRVVLTR
ncbi:MAG: hypothetical protein H8E46_06035 [FCB group bacterium]|nr:hypothetical protein [FCB group bacterium]